MRSRIVKLLLLAECSNHVLLCKQLHYCLYDHTTTENFVFVYIQMMWHLNECFFFHEKNWYTLL